jgi:hypothetical protein
VAVPVITTFLLGLHFLLRKGWALVIAFAAFASVLHWPASQSSMSTIGAGCSIAGVACMLAALRYGLVRMLAFFFCLNAWMGFPVTARLDVPHFGIALVGVPFYRRLGRLRGPRRFAVTTPSRR